MKLKEIDLPQDEVCSIGSGTAYFFIGPFGEFIERAKSGEYDRTLRWSHKNNLQTMRTRVQFYINALRKLPGSKRYKKKLGVYRQRYRNALHRYIHYVDILEREVIETYERISEPGLAIIIEGSETGTLWFYHERFDMQKYDGGD